MSKQIKPISDLESLRVRWGDIIDAYRTALMNCKYNAHRLRTNKRYNLWFEIILAIGTSSAIGAWTIWNAKPAKIFWAVFSAGVIVLTILKPILQIPKEIERYSELHIGYKNLWHDTKSLISEVNATGRISDKTQMEFESAKNRYVELARKEDDPPKKNLAQRCQKEVEREIPVSSFWNPQASDVEITSNKQGSLDEK